MKGYRALLVALLVGAPAAARAQIVLGVVLEEGTRVPVRGAELTLLRANQAPTAAVTTDSVGVFRIVAPAADHYRIRARHLGFATFDSEPIDLSRGETVSLEIRLNATRIALEPLVVTVRTRNPRLSGFHERRLAHTFGRFLTRDEIDRRSSGKTTDLMRGFPGVTIVPAQVRGRMRPGRNLIAMRGIRGTCEPALYLDGMRISQSAESTVDDVLSPGILEGVEVYTSNVGAPPQYTDGGTCGVVLFWTRASEGGARWNWKRTLIGIGAVAAILLVAS